MWLRVDEQASSRVLDVLEFIEEFGWCAIEDAAALVNSEGTDGMDQGFCSTEGE